MKYSPPGPQPKPQLSMFDLLDAKQKEAEESVEEPDDEPTDEDYEEAEQVIREQPQNVDLETGEILSAEEMRTFDGDIEEPDLTDETDDLDISAFDAEAVAVLSELFGDEITLR